jgi:hypothetical protein
MAKDSVELLQKTIEVQARHTSRLMQIQHVVGVAVGMRKVGGKTTDETCLVVMVDSKIALEALPEADRLPREIDGIMLDVQEIGTPKAQ